MFDPVMVGSKSVVQTPQHSLGPAADALSTSTAGGISCGTSRGFVHCEAPAYFAATFTVATRVPCAVAERVLSAAGSASSSYLAC